MKHSLADPSMSFFFQPDIIKKSNKIKRFVFIELYVKWKKDEEEDAMFAMVITTSNAVSIAIMWQALSSKNASF